MSWLRLDDAFPRHPKVAQLTDGYFRIWVRTLCYCAEYRTRGAVPACAMGEVRGLTRQVITRYLGLKLLDPDPDPSLSGQARADAIGYVHDWRIYNPDDPTGAERAKKYRDSKRDSNRDTSVTGDEEKRDAGRDANEPSRAGSRARPVPSPKKVRSSEETKNVRAPDLLWDALDPVYGPVTNDGERGRRNKALKLIRQSLNGVPEPEAAVEVGRRAEVALALYPLGREMALANHWGELGEVTLS